MDRGRDWVSKTDLVTFLRCPYAFWLLDTGQVEFRDTVDVITKRLLKEGKVFHEGVAREAMPLPRGVDFSGLLAADHHVIGFPGFLKNHEYKILGRPDGVRTAHGALLPIEIKAHREVTRHDELELAFYWLLLDPLRTTKDAAPAGYVIARIDGRPETIEVPLKPNRFDEVMATLAAIRKARRDGVTPRICGCPICSAAEIRREIVRTTLEGKDLSLIHGIGRYFADTLEALGMRSYEDLLTADARDVARRLRANRIANVSPGKVKTWAYHAMSFSRGAPVVFGKQRLDFDDMLALDCEYDDRDFSLWLIGVCIMRGGRRDYRYLFAATRRQERTILRRFARLLATHPGLPVVTWAGTAADIAHLRNRSQRLRVAGVGNVLPARHLDAYLFLTRTVRLPTYAFSLKEIAAHFGIRRRSTIQDGAEANQVYRRYLRARGRRKARLKRGLLRYNQDDLDSLIEAVERLREITTSRAHVVPASTASAGARRTAQRRRFSSGNRGARRAAAPSRSCPFWSRNSAG